MTRVAAERVRVGLRKRAYEESKQRLRTGRMSEVYTSRHEGTVCLMIEYEELQQVASSNQRREDRLARVRGKDFSKRLQDMEVRVGGGGGV